MTEVERSKEHQKLFKIYAGHMKSEGKEIDQWFMEGCSPEECLQILRYEVGKIEKKKSK